MAKYDSVLMGTLSQSIDNVTAYVSKQVRIVRHKATKVHNPRTEKQRKRWAKMRAAVELFGFCPGSEERVSRTGSRTNGV